MKKPSGLANVVALFCDRPGEWISAMEIAHVGGLLSSRTRISEARRRFGMDIENEIRVQPDGSKHSFYRLRKAAA